MAWDRLHKNQARELAIDYARGVAKIALFLPSDECLCLLEALKKGRINRKTRIIAVEKDPTKVDAIRKFLTANFDKFYIHEGPITSLKLEKLIGPHEGLDFAFCDFCGDMTEKLWDMVHNLPQYCYIGAQVCFTFTARNRNNPFTAGISRDLRSGKLNTNNLCRHVKDWQPLCRADGTLQHNAALPTLVALASALGKFKIDLGREYRDGRTPMLVFLTTCR